ncbi:MAG: tetratricopeptide repeat protein [Chthoniobacterales bacterium]
MISASRLNRLKLALAFLATALPVCATSITGGGETVETTPTPPPGFSRTEENPDAATKESSPAETPAPELPQVRNLPAPTPVPSDEFKSVLQQARKDFREKNYDDALEKVRKAEALKPDQPDVINFRGAIYAETGRYAEAVKLYEKALALQPNSFWPAYNIGEVDFIQKKYPEARAWFQKMQEKLPKNELLRFKIVVTYLLEKNDAAAKAELDKFQFPSETAAREFAMAAWEFAHNHPDKGQEWMESGVRIFGWGRTDFLYQSMADLNWVPTPRPTPEPPH